LRSRCISSVHRLLNLLREDDVLDQGVFSAMQHLTVSNNSCEALCYDLWLRLIKMMVFLERYISPKTGDKSTVFALEHLESWQEELFDGNHEIWQQADGDKSLRGRQSSELWRSCFNDHLLTQMKNDQKSSKVCTFPSGKSNRNVGLNYCYEPFNSVDERATNLAYKASAMDTLEPNVSNRPKRKGHFQFISDIRNSLMVDDQSSTVQNKTCDTRVPRVGDIPQPKPSGPLKVPLRARSGGLSNSNRTDSHAIFRSPPSLLHSEARKVIAQMSTGSDIIGASSSDLIFRENVLEGSTSLRVNSYLAAVEAAEVFTAQQHSNSNVEISTNKLRKSCSDDHLVKVALARARSLDDVNRPQTGRTISLSHSLADTITCPFDSSEHVISAWDNYQAPCYSFTEGSGLAEPKSKLSENFFWEDLFPDETEALDFERHFHQPQGTTRQIDEWSFDGLSVTPPSFQTFDDAEHGNDDGTRSSDALLEPDDRNLFSDAEHEMPMRHSTRQDKCLQTDLDDSVNGSLTPSTFLNISQGALLHEPNTTHTSGYESGTDMVNCFFRRNSFTSPDGSNKVGKPDVSAFPTTRSFGVQTIRNNRCKTSDTIAEESSGNYFSDCQLYSSVITKSERDIVKLRDFLREILVSSEMGSELTPTFAQGNSLYSFPIEECESLREALLELKLQMIHGTHPATQNVPELSDLESLFGGCLGEILDRTTQDIRYLAEQANGIKSAFIYLETLTERLQTSTPIIRDTVLSRDLDSDEQVVKASSTCVPKWDSFPKFLQKDSIKNYTLDRNRSDYQWKSSSIFIVPPLLLLIFLIALLYISGAGPAREQRFPFRCLGSTWPGCRAIRIYRIGVPPQ
uniref:KASH domain-containing protein n=1 Tax=Hydatigena taeniaeformis TaxID=6205 RepID=A0A0R3WKR4_HYDTA